jgi:hypothetical protein
MLVSVCLKMANQSEYTSELRIAMSTWYHDKGITHKSIRELQADFQERFNSRSPTKLTIIQWERKLFSAGSVKDKAWSGRTLTRGEVCHEVEESLLRSPKYLFANDLKNLGYVRRRCVGTSTFGKKSYRPSFVNRRSDSDIQRIPRAHDCLLFSGVFRLICHLKKSSEIT